MGPAEGGAANSGSGRSLLRRGTKLYRSTSLKRSDAARFKEGIVHALTFRCRYDIVSVPVESERSKDFT